MVRIGFVGFGRMGITHYSILSTHPSVQVAGVCDSSTAMLSILKKYLDVPTYSHYRKMLDEAGLDAIVVSTPGDSHLDIVKAGIEKGLHIFVEKPFALSAQEGKAALAMLEGTPLVNQVGYVNRFNEVFVEVKKLLADGAIGEVKNYVAEMYGATVLRDSKGSWRSKKDTGGGCMYEFASHCIDLALYLFGQPERVVGSVVQSVYSSDVEDLVSSTFIHGEGYTGNIMVNWSDETYRKPANIVTIFGTKGKIIADKHAYKLYLKEARPERGFEKGWNTRYLTEFGKPVRFYLRGNEFTAQLDYFIDCIEQKRAENVACFSDGVKTDIVMEEIRQDAGGLAGNSNDSHGTSTFEPGRKQASGWKRLFK